MTKIYSIFTAVVLIWGFYYLAIDVLLDSGWDPYLMNAIRFTLGGLLLLMVAAKKYGVASMVSIQRRNPVRIIIVSWIGVGLGIALMTLGQKTVDSGLSGVLGSTTPLFSALIGMTAIFGSRVLGKGAWVGVAVGLIGVALLYQPWSLEQGADPIGATLLLAGAFCFALESHLVAKWFSTTDLLPLTAVMVLWSALWFIATFLLVGSVETGNWWLLITMAVFSNAIAYLGYLWLIQGAGPTFANLYAYLVPVIALAAGVILQNEALTLMALLGSAACITGAILVGRDKDIAVDH